MHNNTAAYWQQRYQTNDAPWDIGEASTPIIQYVAQLPNKNISILIPGCGTGYEATYLQQQGFTNITCIDIAEEAINRCKHILPKTHTVTLLQEDFFTHQQTYDLIIEQTFFCALPPTMRQQYVQHMHSLLKPQGKLVGVLFNKMFAHDGPPYGGNPQEYRTLFEPFFTIKTMEPCYNSIQPRAGNEVFVVLNRS
jgi:methyl halide transferase